MLIHTVIDPGEMIPQEGGPKYFYKKVENCVLEGVEYNQEIMLNRIISTNPADYLRSDLRLGQRMRDREGFTPPNELFG